jgi:hypothetical protein
MKLATRACMYSILLGLFVWYGDFSGTAGADMMTMNVVAGADVMTTNVAAVSDAATSSQPRVCVVQIMASGAVLSTFVDHPTDPSLAILVPTETTTNVPVSCQDLTSIGLAVANQEASPVNLQITVFTHQGTPLCTRGPFTLSEHGARGVVFGSDCIAGLTFFDFPSTDSTVVASMRFIDDNEVGYFWSAARGDLISETFTSASPINRTILAVEVVRNVLNSGAFVDWNVEINGVIIGSFRVVQSFIGPVTVDISFPPIPGPEYTVTIRVINEVAPGEGSHTLAYASPFAHSVQLFPVEPRQDIIYSSGE